MIFGIGTDVVAVARIEKILKRFGNKLAERVLAPSELKNYAASNTQAHFLAKRFAIKEAFSKALGTGLRPPVTLLNIAVHHDALGKPLLVLAPALAQMINHYQVQHTQVSVSDEKNLVIAIVVLETASTLPLSMRPSIENISTVPESLDTRDNPPTHEINATAHETDASKQTDKQAFLNTERHFTGVSRLYGSATLARFATSHIGVVGIGGVGSWAAEALARSGIAKLTLIDLDHIAISNTNRQLHTLNSTLGMAKVIAMKQRIADIHPAIVVRVIEDFVTPENVNSLLEKTLDGVLDCTDDVKAKAAIAHWARAHGVPLLMAGSAGGRLDATRLKSADLSVVSHDKLLTKVRQKLRADYGFPQANRSKHQTLFGLPCIYSDENIIYPETSCAPGGLSGLNCAGYGASVCVTASFGFALAGALLKHLARDLCKSRRTG